MLDNVLKRIYEGEVDVPNTTPLVLGTPSTFEAKDFVGCITGNQNGTITLEQTCFSTNTVVKTTTITLVANTPQTIGPVDIFGTKIKITATMAAAAALKLRLMGRL